jgi:HPt (histidine-containing phosphotransfer) domain-containing protein
MTATHQKSVLDASMIEDLKSMQKPGRPDFFLELAALYIETAGESSHAIKTAAADKNFKALSEAAHSLKSSSANIGATQLSKICQELEQLGEPNSNREKLGELAELFVTEYALVIAELTQMQAAA